MEFLLKELNLPTGNEPIIYRGEEFRKTFSRENALENILVDWEFRYTCTPIVNDKGISLDFESYIQKEFEAIFRYGKNKAKVYKAHKHYESFVKKYCLELLNKKFNVQVAFPSEIEGVQYPVLHNHLVRTLEEKYDANVHSVEMSLKNTNSITEQDVEDYLVRHLDLIEDGLQFLQRQVIIKDGRIDILARDIENNYVIIELKAVADCRDIFWQCLFYPIEFEKEFNTNKVRMMTVTPDYPDYILTPLKTIPNVEIVRYIPLVELGKIKKMSIYKLN